MNNWVRSIKRSITNRVALCLSLGLIICFNTNTNTNVLRAQNVAVPGSEIELEWDAVEDAVSYEIRLIPILADGKSRKPLLFKSSGSSWKGRISAGKYKMQLRSYDDRNVPGEWSKSADVTVKLDTPKLLLPKRNSKVYGKNRSNSRVLFKWSKVTDAVKYFVAIESKSGKFNEVFDTKTNSIEVNLKVGMKYSWKVVGVTIDAHKGNEMKTAYSFYLYSPRLEAPKIKQFRTQFPERLEWKGGEGTDNYSYSLYKKSKRGWKKLSSKKKYSGESIPFKLSQPSGQYRLTVKGHATLTKSSPVSKFSFYIQGGLRTPAAIKKAKLREKLGRQSGYYGVASYLVTQISYFGKNAQDGNEGGFDALGGTGRLGLGFRKQGSTWSYLGILDAGGITIKQDNHVFTSLELHGSWSRYIGGSDLLEVSGGIYSKELLEVFQTEGVTQDETDTEVKTFRLSGTHIGASYRKPFNNKIGMMIRSRFYIPLTGTSANGLPLEKDLSYSLGLLGSYNLSHRMIGFLGYAYRLDAYSYKVDVTNKTTGNVSQETTSVEITGHYLNLILEYDF